MAYFIAGIVATQIIYFVTTRLWGVDDGVVDIGNMWILWAIYQAIRTILMVVLTLLLWVFVGFSASARLLQNDDGYFESMFYKPSRVANFDRWYARYITSKADNIHSLFHNDFYIKNVPHLFMAIVRTKPSKKFRKGRR